MDRNWALEIDALKKYILEDKMSYEKIGRIYGCSGTNIKRVAFKFGIKLPKRRLINPSETFNKGIVLKSKAIRKYKNCGIEFNKTKGRQGAVLF